MFGNYTRIQDRYAFAIPSCDTSHGKAHNGLCQSLEFFLPSIGIHCCYMPFLRFLVTLPWSAGYITSNRVWPFFLSIYQEIL